MFVGCFCGALDRQRQISWKGPMLDIVYSDLSFIAVNKSTGLLSVPGRGADKQDCCLHRVQAEYPEALMVHRLDMDTSGLIIFARSLEVQRNLSLQFETRRISKTYVALVEGVLEQDEGFVDLPMRKDMEQRLPPKHIVDHEQGKAAHTDWRVLERSDGLTRVALYPKTGRSHQLRVHMSAIGYPIVGDNIYGTAGDRLMLHAEALEFLHPTGGEPIRLECPAPF
jgi:tRNA pseudouridine32 synthase/23S rRNA pseudouridine746 synthase